MRRLGAELGVEAIALHYYFRGKSALFDQQFQTGLAVILTGIKGRASGKA